MSKQSLLLVDGDTRSLRVLEVSLRKAGFSVTPAVSVGDALDKLEVNAPDLIISETKFTTELDGFELRRRLRNTPGWADIPFIFLTAETAIENKIKGLELGVDDYLTKPIYIKEIVTRINILLQKRQRQFLDLKKDGTRFAGRVTDMPVVDVIQTIEVSRKSGVIQFSNGPARTATIYFREGKVIDAEAGTLQGEDAVYRLLTWNEGEFEVEFRTVRRRETITTSSQGLLMEGMRRLDEWSRLLEQLPPLSHRFEIDATELAGRLGEIPDDNNRILRLFDGKRTLLEVIDSSDFGDLECLQAISRLYFEGLLIDLDPGVRSRRDTGKSGPHLLSEIAPVTPIEEVVSGPIDILHLSERLAQEEAAAKPAEQGGRDARRGRRSTAEQIEENNILTEEEIRGPLSGGYRPSSLRLIDEAVAAAQAIEPSLFEPGELDALGLNLSVRGLDPVAAAAARPTATRVDTLRGVPLRGEPQKPGSPLGESPTGGPLRAKIEEAKPLAVRVDTLRGPAELPNLELPSLQRAKTEKNESRTVESAKPSTLHAPKPAQGPKSADARRSADAPKSADAPRPTVPKPADARGSVPKPADVRGSVPKPADARGPTEVPKPAEPEPRPSEPALARVSLQRRAPDPRIEAARSLVEKTPGVSADRPGANGDLRDPARTRAKSVPPPLPNATGISQREIENAPFVDAEPEDDHDKARRPHADEPTRESLREIAAAREIAAMREQELDDSSGIPTAIDPADILGEEIPTDPSLPLRRFAKTIRRDDSQRLRMIGSYGRDRAEASGELRAPMLPPTGQADVVEPQRELVTILPRRITREIKVAIPEGEAQPIEAETEADVAQEAPPLEEETPFGPGFDPPIEPPQLPPPRRVSIAGGVVSRRGPGRAAQVLMGIAAVLVCITTYTYCKKARRAKQVAVARHDAMLAIHMPDAEEEIEIHTPDAAVVIAASRPDAAVALAPPDAAVIAVRSDAAVAPADAALVVATRPDASSAPRDATVVASSVDAGIDKSKEARALFDKAHTALEDGDPERALELLDQSLKLRRTARSYLERARALQRMNRIDEAIASTDEAIGIQKDYAPAYEQKGMILWSAQRHGEARPVLQRYLELEPEGRKAPMIRDMLDELK